MDDDKRVKMQMWMEVENLLSKATSIIQEVESISDSAEHHVANASFAGADKSLKLIRAWLQQEYALG